MRRIMLVLMVMGCGRHGAGATADGGAATDGGATLDASNGRSGDGDVRTDGDGGASLDASSVTADGSYDGTGAGEDGGSGDDTVETGCAPPVAPSVTLSVASTSIGPGVVFRAGDQILAKPVIDETHTWLRWTSGGWSAEPIPWPSNLPTDHDHYIARVVPLATTKALIVTDDRWIMTYDGATMSSAIQPPAATDAYIWGYAQDAAGAYHVYWGTQEWISKPDGTWNPPTPVPIPQVTAADVDAVAAIMRSGRVVVEYLDANTPTHAHLVSRAPNEPWTAAVDITSQWAVNAEEPQLYAPPGGGIAIYVTGASTNYTLAALWRSADALTLGDYETIANGSMFSFTGECLDSMTINGAVPGSYALFDLEGLGWSPFATHTAVGVQPGNVSVAALANGKTFWAVGTFTGEDYLVSP